MVARIGCVVGLVAITLTVSACDSEDDEPNTTAAPSITAQAVSATPTVNAHANTARYIPEPTFVHTPPPELLAELDLNRAKWDSAGIENYRYNYTIACYCGYQGLPITMVVRDGELESMTNSDGVLLTPGYPYDLFYRHSSMELVFQAVEDDIRHAFGVVVTYDAEYGSRRATRSLIAAALIADLP